MARVLYYGTLLLVSSMCLVQSSEEILKPVEATPKCSTGELGCDIKTTDQRKPSLRLTLPVVNGIRVGYEQEVEIIQGMKHTIKTLSVSPPVFEIPEFFSSEECDLVMDLARNKGLKDSPLVKDPKTISTETSKGTFDDWDTNNDGFIDTEEIMYLPGKSDLYFTEEDVHSMFKTLLIDKDGDGKMSFEEFGKVTVNAIKEYFEGLRRVKSRLRSRNSQQTWLWHDEDELLQYEDLLEDYHDRLSKMTLLPRKMIEQSEPLQVVRYGEHGHYHCHHDSEIVNTNLTCCAYGAKNCRLCRFLTVLIFLNDVDAGGELAFPVADNKTFTWASWTKESKTKCNLAKYCSESNLVVKPQRGKAIMFYNHLLDRKSRWLSALDPRAFHGGCDVTKGQKWIANVWINVLGDGVNELRSWKSNGNWLSGNNMDQEIVSALKRDKSKEDIEENELIENRYTKEKNTETTSKVTEDETLELPPKRVGIEVDRESSASPTTNEATVEHAPTPSEVDDASTMLPRGPKVKLSVTPAPLPLPREDMVPKEPKGPKVFPSPLPQSESGNRILRSIMLLIDELDQVELEIVARNLHTRLKLVCIPLIMNPMGSFK